MAENIGHKHDIEKILLGLAVESDTDSVECQVCHYEWKMTDVIEAIRNETLDKAIEICDKEMYRLNDIPISNQNRLTEWNAEIIDGRKRELEFIKSALSEKKVI